MMVSLLPYDSSTTALAGVEVITLAFKNAPFGTAYASVMKPA
jgi:hypothetical protein